MTIYITPQTSPMLCPYDYMDEVSPGVYECECSETFTIHQGAVLDPDPWALPVCHVCCEAHYLAQEAEMP